MKFIRKVFNDAIRMNKVEVKDNPFLKYRLKTEKTQRTFLKEDELKTFAEVEGTPGTRTELHQICLCLLHTPVVCGCLMYCN